MPRYADLYHKATQELAELKAAASPVQRLISHSCLVEALLAVVSRHGLLDEFSKELSEREARLWSSESETIASAIRAAVSKKTAESGHSPSTHNSESE